MALRVHSDFMSTYTWIVIAIFIVVMVGIGAVLFWPSAPIIEHSCSIVSGLTCVSAALGSHSGGSELFLRITNKQGHEISLSNNAVSVQPYIDNRTYSGSCSPGTVANGASFLCMTYIEGYEPQYGVVVSPGFSLAYGICGGNCSAGGSGYIVSGTTYVTAGQTMQQAAAATS